MNSQLDQLTSSHGSTRATCSGAVFSRLLRRVLHISSLLLLLGAAPMAAAYNIAFTNFDAAEPWLNADGSASGAVDSSNVPVGGIAVYRIEINNTASTDGVGLGAVFDLPGTMSIHEMPTYCAYAAGSTTRVQCTLPALPGGAPFDITLKVATAGMPVGAAVIYGAVGTASNFPPLTTPVKDLSTSTNARDPFFDGDLTLTNNKQSATVTLGNSADLGLTKTADVATVIGGGIVTYTLKVDNHGPASSTNFKVIDNLPVGFEYVANSFVSTTSGWTWDAATQTATYAGTLPSSPGPASAVFTFKAKANVQSGNVTNSARVESVGTPDTNPSNNSDTVDTNVGPGADVAIAATWSPSPVASEGALDLVLKVDNHGPIAAENVVVKGKLPAGTTFDSFEWPASWSCTPPDASNEFTCTRTGALPPGSAGETITVKTHAPAASGNHSAPISVTTTTPDPDLSNNDRTAVVSVLAAGADLELGKRKEAVDKGLGNLAEVIVPIGGKMTSTITLTNRGPAEVTDNAVITDTLAIGEEFDPTGTSGDFTCTATPWSLAVAQVVTCTLLPAKYNIKLNEERRLVITTIARAPGAGANGALINNACANLDPITDSGVNKDNVPANNCKSAGLDIGVSPTSADLKVSKTTRAPNNGDRLVEVTDTEMSYEIVVTNTGAATAGIVINDPIPG